MKNYDAHVFICSSCRYPLDQKRPELLNPKEEAGEIRKKLKEEAKEIFRDKKVRISSSSCLGHCKEGLACVIYPQGEWLTNLRPNDIKEKVFQKITQLTK